MLVFGERENHSTRGKPSQNRVENQQAQSTYDGRSGIKPGGKQVLSHFTNPALLPSNQ